MKKIILSQSAYTWSKWITLIVLPALATLVTEISKVIGHPDTGLIVAEVITAVATFLGTILCISNYNYYNRKEEDKS